MEHDRIINLSRSLPRLSVRARYALTLLAFLATFALRWMLDPILGGTYVYTLLYAAIAIAVCLLGWRAATLVALLGYLFAEYLFAAPRYSWLLPENPIRGVVSIAIYALTGAIVIALGEGMRRAASKAEHEVAERTRTEESLRRSHQTFFNLVTQAPLGVYVVDHTFRIAHVSQGAQPAFQNVRPLIGHDFAEAMRILWPEAFADEAIRRFRHTLDTGESYVAPSLTERREDIGTTESYEWEIHRIIMPDGTFGVVCYYYVSTAIRLAERALRDSQQLLKAMLEQLPGGVGVTDMNGLWTLTNPLMERYLPRGIPSVLPDRVVRWQAWDDAGKPIPPEDWPGKRALRGEATVPGLAMLHRTDEGADRWMRVSAAPLRDDQGTIIGATCIMQDIDDLWRAEQEIRAHRDNLQQLVEERSSELVKAQRHLAAQQRMAALGTLAAGLAHDMKNVLMPLSARLDAVMSASGLAGEARTNLAVVVALLDHLREMARNLSLFARDPEQEGIEGSTSLAPWCSRVKGFIESSIADSSHAPRGWIRINWDCPDGLPPVAVAPHRLTQAVLNLVHNARDAILTSKSTGAPATSHDPERGCITVAAREVPGGDAVEISVTDDGCGMNEETRSRCVEPFFTTKDRPAAAGLGGSGLGMSLVHAIVERAGGDLTISSVPGDGTTITMALPIASPGHDPTPQAVRQARVSIEDKRTRALVIESLRSLRYEAVDGHPEDDSPSVLWVTDGKGVGSEHAAAFLGLRAGRRVVALGVNDDWREAGAVVCERTVALSQLRRVLAGESP